MTLLRDRPAGQTDVVLMQFGHNDQPGKPGRSTDLQTEFPVNLANYIADVARGLRIAPFGRPVQGLRKTEKAPMMRHEGGYYIRLMARDLAGTAATIATRLAQQKISLESNVQRHPDGVDANGAAKKASPVPVILITYATSEDAVYRALEAVQRDKVISGRPQVIRIEKN